MGIQREQNGINVELLRGCLMVSKDSMSQRTCFCIVDSMTLSVTQYPCPYPCRVPVVFVEYSEGLFYRDHFIP